MNFKRLDDAFTECKLHLDATKMRGTQVEGYLVSHLLVVTLCEYEQCLQAIFAARARKAGDGHIENVVKRWAKTAKNRMKVTDLKGHLGAFDASCAQAFDAAMLNTQALTSYESIESHRQSVAHGTGAVPSFSDLESHLEESKKLLICIAESLSLTPAEIAAITWT